MMTHVNFSRALIWGSVVTTVACTSLFQGPAQSIQLADGTTYFANVPRLENVRTTFDSARVFGATYYFTLSLPDDADEPLKRVMFNQQEGVDRVKFNLNRTQAYTDDQRKFPLQIADVSADTKGSITVWFDPPVPPGEKVVIGLRPYRNPSSSGIYLFGVTAFPHGDQAHGQFLGYGRLHFYDRFRRPFH